MRAGTSFSFALSYDCPEFRRSLPTLRLHVEGWDNRRFGGEFAWSTPYFLSYQPHLLSWYLLSPLHMELSSVGKIHGSLLCVGPSIAFVRSYCSVFQYHFLDSIALAIIVAGKSRTHCHWCRKQAVVYLLCLFISQCVYLPQIRNRRWFLSA